MSLGPTDRRISLIVVDIDGCLIPRGVETPGLAVLARVEDQNRRSRSATGIPPITLCSGRPQPYVELMMKLIAGRIPALFEWGAGLYDPTTDEILYNDVGPGAIESRVVIREIIHRELVRTARARVQAGKEVAITVYPRDGMSGEALRSELQHLLEGTGALRHYVLESNRNHVDLLPIGVDKGAGIRLLTRRLHLDLAHVAAIGDDASDLPMLRLAGYAACPRNASEDVKSLATYVSPYNNGHGVVDILDQIAGMN